MEYRALSEEELKEATQTRRHLMKAKSFISHVSRNHSKLRSAMSGESSRSKENSVDKPRQRDLASIEVIQQIKTNGSTPM